MAKDQPLGSEARAAIAAVGPNGLRRLRRTRSSPDVKAAARELTPQALGTLQEIMEDKKAPPAARVTAATEILSRGWGRPAQRLEAEAGNGTMSFLALVQASFSPEVEARARERMLLEGHAIPDPERVTNPERQ